jgi:REP element-mobilizing transposase RayT
MPSTHLSLHYHLTFSTKNRLPLIAADWRARLHAYLGGCVRTLGGVPETVGGVEDHVHLLIGLKAMHRLADVLRDIKQQSSEWVHWEIGESRFAWQEGYGGFTVSVSHRERLREYIANQEEHHEKVSFQDEYIRLLEKHGIEFKKEYLW